MPPKDAPDTDTGVDSTTGDDMNAARSPQPEQRPRFAVPGQVIILTVALLWGTNPPALRYLYASDGTAFHEPETDVTCATVRRIEMLYAHRLRTTGLQHGVRGDVACLGLPCLGPPSPAALAGVQATAAATLLLLLSAARSRLQGGSSSGAGGGRQGNDSRSLPSVGSSSRPRGRPAEQQEPSRRWRREPADLADADTDPEAEEPELRNPQVQRLIDLESAGSGGSPSVRRWAVSCAPHLQQCVKLDSVQRHARLTCQTAPQCICKLCWCP